MSVCGREKCAFKRKPYPPGVHGKAFRRQGSEFGSQLAEKQKLKFLYGLRERQFRNYIENALKQKGVVTSDAIINSLESRLDNAVYRIGYAPTRAAARQIVNHGHVQVNGKRVNIPSYRLKIGDEVKLRELSKSKPLFQDLEIMMKKAAPPSWLELDRGTYAAKMKAPPSGEGLGKGYNINAIVEYYSR